MKVLHRENGRALVRFDIGEEFPGALAEWCGREGIRSAAVLCGIGMLRDTEIGRYDGRAYRSETVPGPSEVLSLQGNVSLKEGEPFVHLHVSLADEDLNARGGHLFSGTVAMTIELLMLELGTDLVRLPSGGDFWQLDTGG